MSTDDRNIRTVSLGINATDHENSSQNVVILTETDQELHLNQHAEQVELKAQQVLESFPFYLSSSDDYLVDFQTTLPDATESYPTSSRVAELLQQLDAAAYPTDMSFDSQHRTVLEKGIAETTDIYDSPQNTSLQPGVFNKTDSHRIFNLTFPESDTERTTKAAKSTYKSDTQEPTVADRNPKDKTETPQGANDSQDMETSRSNVSRERDSGGNESDHEESFLQGNLDPRMTVKLEETTVHTIPSTQASKEEVDIITQTAQTAEPPIKNQFSRQTPVDGSGDASQGTSHLKYTPRNPFYEQPLFKNVGF